MEAILHTLGICPDNFSHIDIMDIVACYYNELQMVIQIIKNRFS